MLTAFTYYTINNRKAFTGIKILTTLLLIFKWKAEYASLCNDDAYISLAINDAVISLMQNFQEKSSRNIKLIA
jgi:hypothetical protein